MQRTGFGGRVRPDMTRYWYYRDGFFDDFAPGPHGLTLEVGCGEGRVARDLTTRGHRVTAIDTSHSLLRYARDEDGTSRYALADSGVLPFPDDRFALAVAYNALQVVGDMAATVAEIARVLEHGGSLCAVIAHPVTDLGRFQTLEEKSAFTLRDGYFERVRVDDTVESNGLTMTFRGWTYSLEDYSVAFEDAGLRIEAIREPRPAGAASQYEKWQHVPQFMFIRAVKP